MRKTLSPALVLSLALAPPAARAQQQAPGTRTEVVQLDVIVTDADGTPVRGLTRDDFQVLEDRKEQRLTNFVFVERGQRAQAAPTAEPAPAAAPEGAAASAEPPASLGRHLVIVIDDLHIAPGNIELVKGALRRMVDEFLGPDDFAALVTTSSPAGSQQLTQDAATVKQSITQLAFRQAPAPPAAGTEMTAAQAELILRGDRTARRLAGRKLIEEPGSVLSPTSPRAATQQGEAAIGGSAAGAGAASAEALESIAEREAERQARAVLNEALRHSAASLHTVEDVLRSLAPLPGRKLCLLVSDGFLVGTGTSEERTSDLRAIIDAATRSGAVVYAIDSRGLQGSMGDASVAGSSSPATGLQTSVDRQSAQLLRLTLESISADTGGFLVTGTNAFDAGLRRVLAENDSYYLMAYEPTNRKRDGKYRRIEVKLPKHARYVVRTRRGYLAPDDSRPEGRSGVRRAAATPQPRGIEEGEARTIIEAARRESGLALRMSADFVNVPKDGSIAIVHADVDLTALAAETGGSSPLGVDILGGVYDAGGQPIGPAFGHHADVAASDLKRARERGVQFQQRLALPPGRYEIRLAARDASLSRLGGASQWVEIPDLKQGALALSGVFLSSSTPKAGGPGGEAGEDLREVQASRRFGAKDNLYFQVYVYNLHEDGGADAVLQAQLRQGETLVAASSPQPVKPQRKDGVLLPQTNGMPLAGLAPGRYELRVVVMDKKANATASRQIDFTIE